MNYLITNEPHEQLELRPSMDNNSISLVQKRRARVVDEWNTKIIILNREEALKIHKAIADIMLAPKYSLARVRQ